jgi:hypothetical protein
MLHLVTTLALLDLWLAAEAVRCAESCIVPVLN